MRRRNVRWQVGDATELQLPAGCADVVFSNWLLMYLSDAEVTKLAGDALTWVCACFSSVPCIAPRGKLMEWHLIWSGSCGSSCSCNMAHSRHCE